MELFKHQIEDAAFLASKSVAGCFSGMGTGKTLTALEAARLVDAKTILVIAPPIALSMWADVAADYLDASACILRSGKTPIPDSRGCTVVICSYQIATSRHPELSARPWDVMICDESHALKSVKAKRTKAILGRGGIIERTKHAWLLTGTPVTRWNDDIFPFLCRAGSSALVEKIGKLDMDRFRLRYCVTQKRTFPGSRYPTTLVVGSRNTDELSSILYPNLAVRRELKEVWDAMPPLTETRLQISLRMSDELRGVLSELSKLRQSEIEKLVRDNGASISRARRLIGEAKVEAAVDEIIDRLESGAGGLLVGAWHRSVIGAISELLRAKGVDADVIDGSTSHSERDDVCSRFNSGAAKVVICQIAAAGVSLNLQHGGNRILVVEEDWSPAIMDQFFARLHRIGQTRHVHIDTLVSDTPLDKALYRISRRKSYEHDRLSSHAEEV